MANITITKFEYTRLQRQADAYRKLASRLFEAVARDPIDEVVGDFRKTGVYTEGFLTDLKDGLAKSSY